MTDLSARLGMTTRIGDVSRETSEQLAQDGIAKAKAHAESLDPEWSKTALVMLQGFAVTGSNEPFTSEHFRFWCEEHDFKIPVPKALGHVFRAAARSGHIRKVGYEASLERHGSPTVLWRAT